MYMHWLKTSMEHARLAVILGQIPDKHQKHNQTFQKLEELNIRSLKNWTNTLDEESSFHHELEIENSCCYGQTKKCLEK